MADDFADEYGENLEGFKALICAEEIAASGSYHETWDFILKGVNSLNRFSNFHLIFQDEQLFAEKEDEQ